MAGNRPRFTENFSANLSIIEEYLEPHSRTAFHRFLDRLFDDVIPTLCRFPQSGRSFVTHAVKSTKAKVLHKKFDKLLSKGDDLREFVMDEYLVLYLEPISKLFEEHGDAGELHKAKEVRGIILPADQ